METDTVRGHVREQGWTFEKDAEIDIGKDGRAFFGGNLNERSAACGYLIPEDTLLKQVVQAVPEVSVRR